MAVWPVSLVPGFIVWLEKMLRVPAMLVWMMDSGFVLFLTESAMGPEWLSGPMAIL